MVSDVQPEQSAQATLTWALQTYRERIAIACSFGGPSGMVILDMALRIDCTVPVYFLETGVLFAETYDLIGRVKKHYGIVPIAVASDIDFAQQAARFGDALWERDPDACCRIRKVEPQQRYLANFDAWVTGVRRDQSHTRKNTALVTWDTQFRVTKISPLALWTERAVWTYIHNNNVPYNTLHDAGYPSIGCTHCTRAVVSGEDMRAGRWQNSNKTECGLHAQGAS